MTNAELLGRFEEARTIFRELRAKAIPAGDDERDLYLAEAQTRIEQSRYLLHRFMEIEQEFIQHDRRGRQGFTSKDEHRQWADTMATFSPQLEVHGEAFYYFAFRLRQVLKNGVDGFKNFDPIGVRDVRNHLIEHADRGGGVMDRNHMFNCPEGLVIKPFGGSNGRYQEDRGLYPNATEFIDELLRLLKASSREPDARIVGGTPDELP